MESRVCPRQLRVEYRVRRPDFQRSLELLHGFRVASRAGILCAEVDMGVAELGIDLNSLLQFADGARSVVRSRISLRVYCGAEGLLGNLVPEFAQRNDAGYGTRFGLIRQTEHQRRTGWSDLAIRFQNRFRAGRRQDADGVRSRFDDVETEPAVRRDYSALDHCLALHFVELADKDSCLLPVPRLGFAGPYHAGWLR